MKSFLREAAHCGGLVNVRRWVHDGDGRLRLGRRTEHERREPVLFAPRDDLFSHGDIREEQLMVERLVGER